MTSESGPTRPSGGDDWAPDGVPVRFVSELSAAMSDQADRFEPSNDAYRNLAQAVAEAGRPTAARWLRPLAIAASVAAVVGLGASVLAARDSQQIGTGPGGGVTVDDTGGDDGGSADAGDVTESTDPMDDDGATTDGDPDGESEQGTAEDVGSNTEVEPGQVIGPVRSSELAAAQAFLDLVRLRHGSPELVDGEVVVRSLPEGGGAAGDGPIVAELALAEVTGGFAVVEATTASIVIDEVSEGDLSGGTLTVTGTGVGFESSVGVTVVSALDNRVLATGSARTDGLDRATPYRAELAVVGAERAWVLVTGGGGADGVVPPFAARSVSYRAGDDPADYAVVRVPPDDPDDGLNLRSGPGSTQQLVATIPAGAGGIRRAGVDPVLVGDDTWWLVTSGDGDRGWVNSFYLAAADPVPDGRLRDLALSLGGEGAPLGSGTELSLGRRGVLAVGTITDPIEVDPESLLSGRGWSEPHTVSVPPTQPGGDPQQLTGSLTDLLGLGLWVPESIEVGAGFASPSDEQAAARYFGGLPRLAVTVTGPDGSDVADRRVFVFAEATATGAEIVGLIVEFQPEP